MAVRAMITLYGGQGDDILVRRAKAMTHLQGGFGDDTADRRRRVKMFCSAATAMTLF